MQMLKAKTMRRFPELFYHSSTFFIIFYQRRHRTSTFFIILGWDSGQEAERNGNGYLNRDTKLALFVGVSGGLTSAD